MDWPKAIVAIVSLLRKWGGMIAAYFAGRNTQKEKERAKDDKAKIKDLEARLDAARDIDRASRDDAERERVRSRYTKPDPPRP